MHQFFKSILFISAAVIFSFSTTKAQVDKPVNAVFEITGFNTEKTLPLLQDQFQQNGYLILKSVCITQGWIFVQADPVAFANDENILLYLQEIFPGVLLKNNALEEEMVQNCSGPVVYLDP